MTTPFATASMSPNSAWPEPGAEPGAHMTLALTDRHSARGAFPLAAAIRGFEQMLLDQFSRGHIGGTTHTCIGQEIAVVAITAALDRGGIEDNHRRKVAGQSSHPSMLSLVRWQ